MSKMRRLLAAVLVASMILGSNGIAYAAEAAGTDDTVSAVEVTEEAAEKESKSAADAELPDEPEEASAEEDSNEAVEASQDDSSETIESEEASEQSEPEEAPAEEVSSEEPADEEEASVEETEADDSEDEDASAEENIDAESEEESADEASVEESDEAASTEDASEAASEEEASEAASEEEAPEAAPAEATTEEAAAQATTQEVAQEVFTAGELVYHGNGFDVTMAYDEKAEIPSDAQLKVREIKKGTDEYDAYLSGAQAASDKGVAEARFFDITIWAKDKEIQPKSAVRVNISYKKAIDVADEGEVKAMHFEDGTQDPDVLDTDTNGGSKVDEIAFDAESFSVYGVVYTVDFTYEGFTFTMPGEGSVLLSILANELNLYEKDYDKAFSVDNVSDVTFTDYDLIKIEKQADGDWLLTSLASFESEETLTITMEDGVKFVIDVTDPPAQSSNLEDFLTNAVITGVTQNADGEYEVVAGTEYSIILSFAESATHQFINDATLTYQMPDGMKILSPQSGDMTINVVYNNRTYQVDATYDLDTDGKLEIKFKQDDPDYQQLERTTNVSFRFTYNGAFDGTENKIHFSEDIERDVVFDEPEPGQAYVSKNGTFDEETGKFNYTITVNATGDITNVNVKDVITGDALTFNNDVSVSGNSSSYTDNGAANGFDYTFDSMQEGEVITITYSASVDFTKDDDKDGKISVDQTKNTATVQPKDGEPHNSEYSHEIAFKTTKKSEGTNTGTTAGGDKIYKWTITYNELRLASAGGDTIKDTIAADSTEYMKYYGDGLIIKVIDKNGNVVDTRNVPYSDLQSYSDSSWTYKIPEGDSQPYMYEITYYTVVDMEKVEGTGNTVTVTNDANGSGGSADVTPESVISVDKSVESFTTEEVNWKITLGVPENGLTQAVVTDNVPYLGEMNLYDLFKDGSLQITGLLDGESYTVETVGRGQVKITFFQDPGKNTTGLKAAPGGHTITVKLTTLVDQEWLQKGYETGGYYLNHTNTVSFNGKLDTATVVFGKPGVEKTGEVLKDSQDNITGLKYTVVLKGVSETPVSVLDTFDTSILEVDTSKASEWDYMQIWGGTQYYQGEGKTPISYTDTGDGIILTADTVPMQTDGSYYPYYKIVYYLKVKDGVDLKALAIANGGEYKVNNTVKWGDHESEFSYKVEYDYLDKELLNAGELGGTSRTAKYKITFNPSKATLNEGENMTMTDVLSANLSVDYSSIQIVTDPAGQSVVYSLSGDKDEEGHPTGKTVATYTIPDSTSVTITYDASVRGNGTQTITNKVSVNGKEETVENTKSYGSASEGEGAKASFKIVKVDGYDANKKLQGVKFKIFCENPDLDFGGGRTEIILTTDENGEIVFDGNQYDFYFDVCYHVQEVEAAEDYGTISFDYLVTLTTDMSKVDYGNYIYYFSDSMQIKNWPLEGLIVEKQVESDDPDDLEDYYHFRISVLNDDGSVNTDYNEKNGDDDFVNGVVEFDLKNREQKMFWGFAKGTKYKVQEIGADGFATTVTYSVYDEDGNVTEVETETTTTHSGELTQEDETIVFTNKKTSNGSLKLKKLVTVNGESTTGTLADGEYTFTITGPEGAETPVTKKVVITVTNGAAVSAKVDGASVTLDSNKYVEVTDLAAGTYTINETAPSNGTSLVGDNGKKVTVVAGESGKDVSAKADFTNNIDLGSLKIKKNVLVNGESTTGTSADGTYTFEVKDAEGTVVATKTITIENGVSNEVQVDNLVPGTYTVSEDTSKLPEGKGMVLIGSNNVEIIVEAKNTANIPTAEFTNNKPGTPEFEKKIKDINDSTGDTSGWQDSADYDIGDAVPYKLTAKLPNDVSTNSSYSIRFEDQMEDSLTFEKVSDVTLNGESIKDDCAIDFEDHNFTVSISWSGEAVTEALNGATVDVYFTATLNEGAKIGSQGNVNAARLRYDNKSEITDDSGKTPWDYVIAFTYKLDVNKVDQDGKALTGAEFKLEKKIKDSDPVEVELTKAGNVFTGKGLDDGTYVLTETKAPQGYKQIDPIEFTVTAEHGITWDYTSIGDEPVFDGTGRTGVLTLLTGETESGDLEFKTPQTVAGLVGTVTNQKTGSLKIKKNVTVDGQPTTETKADGTYTFTVKDSKGEVVSTQTITITNGASGEVEVDGLVPGTYTVSEETGRNPSGMQLVTDNDLRIVVTAGETAEVPTAEFTNNKPGTPTFEKKIQDTNDTTGETSSWQDSADYDIGDEIPYKLTATLANDVSTYKSYSIMFEDQMEDTLTFKGVSKVILTKNDGSTQDITLDSVFTPTSGGQRFTVNTGWGRNYSAERMPISELLNGATVDVYFTAQLNANAKLGNEGNVNAARLRYSNNPNYAVDFEYTPWDYVIAFTYKLDVNKVDQDGKALTGAEFKLEKKIKDSDPVEVELTKAGNVFTGKGLDDGTYVLTETKAPQGYKPIDPIEFTVTAKHGITWDYNSTGDAPVFDGTGRTDILTELTGKTDSGDLKFTTPQTVAGLVGTVTNHKLGSLKLTKIVTVDGKTTTGTEADGSYTFTIAGPAGTDEPVSKTVVITIENGKIKTAKIDGTDAAPGEDGYVEVTGLEAGDYTITETAPTKAGVKLVSAEGGKDVSDDKIVTVTVADDLTGDEVPAVATASFTNDYSASGTAELEAIKEVTGAAWPEGATATFTVTAEGKIPMPKKTSVTLTEAGTADFGTIDYTLADAGKTYTYTITESGSNFPTGWSASPTTITATVVVGADNGDGTLKESKVKYSPANKTITNKYETKGSITFSGTKALENRKLKEGEFSFELYEVDGENKTLKETVSNAADGSYSFSEIKYTGDDLGKDAEGNYNKTATKTYKVKEKNGGQSINGVAHAVIEYEIEVTLTDDGMGHIDAETIPDPDTYDFTNAYNTVGNITFSGTKKLENRKLKEGEFSFELYEVDGENETLKETVSNAADGSYSFSEIKYTGEDLGKDAEGNYNKTATKSYKVVEKDGGKKIEGVTYDGTPYEITVTLTDDGKGHIAVTADPKEDSYNFKNTYETEGSITFSGTKKLENRKLEEGEFSFELYEVDGENETLKETVSNAADGSYSFSEIRYTGDDLGKDAEGNYNKTATKTYKVKEKAGADASVTYDGKVYEITVTLTDDRKGHIDVTADPAEDTYDFTNTYNAKGEVVIEAGKFLERRPLEKDRFKFDLVETLADGTEKTVETVGNSNDGSITFSAIEYTQDDMDKDADGNLADTVKTYTIKEQKEDAAGYTYSEEVYTVNVTLHDDRKGTIETTKDKEPEDLVFTNTYSAKGEIVIEAGKKLVGKDKLEEGQFSFELRDAEGKVLQTKSNKEDGSVTFDAIGYTQDDIYEKDEKTGEYSGADTKSFTYTINEVIPEGATDNGDGTYDLDGYTYDGTVYTVKVTATDNGDGIIAAKIDGAEDSKPVFTNAYKADGTLKLDAEKTFKNGTLKGNDFTFELLDADGNVLQSKKNDAAGKVSFDLITYEIADTARSPITYTVKESAGSRTDVKYDETIYTITVTLKDNGKGKLDVTKVIDNGGKLKFVNEQRSAETSITLGGVKTLEGQELKSGMFSFVLKDQSGKWVGSASNDANGNFTFGKITYKLADLKGERKKVYTYKIAEVKGSKSGIIYDTRVYTVTVTVTDNGDGTMTAKADTARSDVRFVNKTETKKPKKKDSTRTGDEAPLGVLFGGLGIGVVGLAVLLEDRRRKNKKG